MARLYSFDTFYTYVKQNRWMLYFTWINRVALSFGFFTAGMVKIVGERFASGLSSNHPMGHYLTALHQTGYYYTFIGIAQVVAAILLLIPRTATLGALLYFPIIFNICILSYAVRFEGSLVSSTLMVLSNLYLLCWDYDKLRAIVSRREPAVINNQKLSKKFPMGFFAGVVLAVALVVVIINTVCSIMPRNSFKDCATQYTDSKNPQACIDFCDCIHRQGKPLDSFLKKYRETLYHQAATKNAP